MKLHEATITNDGERTHGSERSPHWPTVRKSYLEKHPLCECCGGHEKLNVHHVHPFHLHPELELEESNLITLCEGDQVNCHLAIGHLFNFKLYNPEVRKTSAELLELFTKKKQEIKESLSITS